MSRIPTKTNGKFPSTSEQIALRRKADREWDMAGLARYDRDDSAAKRHTDNAREYERKLSELME